jgi:O-methyltransferase domain
VLHDLDDAQAVQILAACRQALSPRSRVLIVERLIPDDPAEAVPVLLSYPNMLVFSGGRERTNAEYAQLLTGAGLRLARIQPAAAPYGIIEGLIT